jgi:hypothetical protein
MSKKLQLQVPVPCHEDWEKMTNAEKGRFCSCCQKTVIDFSNMSDREIALFFKKPSIGSVCGRFMVDQLDREMDIPKKRIPWVKYFFHFLLPGFLLSMKATAQGKVKVAEKEIKISVKNSRHTISDQGVKYTGSQCTITQGIVAPVNIEPMVPISNHPSVHGKVVDEHGEPLPFATVIIKGTKNGVVTDSNGVFILKPGEAWDSICLVASCVGYLSAEARLSYEDAVSNSIILLKAPSISMGEVVITQAVHRHTMGLVMSVITISVDDKISAPMPQPHFKVFPNPLQAGSTLHIEWNQKQFGDHSLQLFNQAGQLIFRKEIYIDQEERLLSIDPPRLSAGSYFLTITNNKTAKSYSEKIIIQ